MIFSFLSDFVLAAFIVPPIASDVGKVPPAVDESVPLPVVEVESFPEVDDDDDVAAEFLEDVFPVVEVESFQEVDDDVAPAFLEDVFPVVDVESFPDRGSLYMAVSPS